MLRVALYQTWDDVLRLRGQWNELLSRSTSATVFLTWEWCEVWWKHYNAGRELFVLGAWDGSELVAIAPLYIDRVHQLGHSWKCLRLIGDGSHDSDYLDCFAVAGREAETMAAFADFLALNCEAWDWMELHSPRKGSDTAAALLSCVKERGWKFATELIPCATLKLPGSQDAYLRMLEPRFRTKVRSAVASLTTIKSTPIECRSEHEIDAWLSSLFDLHTRRWASENKPGVFRDPVKREFYRSLSRVALERRWLAFHRVNWGERTLALQYGLLYQNRFHLLQEGYDPDFAAVRPGVALRAWSISHWIDHGLEEYDFLAGIARHKLDWGACETFSIRLIVSAKPLPKMVALDFPKLKIQVREKVSRATPQLMQSWRRSILSKIAERKNSSPRNSQTSSPGQIARRFVSTAYASRLIADTGKGIATRYRLTSSSPKWSLSIRRRDRSVVHILQYHRVNDEGDPFLGGLAIDVFRAQMQYISRNFPIVKLDQVANADSGSQQPYSIAVTFDDGYRDNFTCAFPILKELGIPATIFLATGYIESGQLPWYDQVRLAFKLTVRTKVTIDIAGAPGGDLANPSSRLRVMELTLGWLRGLPEAERTQATTHIFRALGVSEDLNLPNQLLRWEDIRQMSRQNIAFGAHTVTHPVLSKIADAQLKREIEGSKRTIENRLQTPALHFAYPFGQAADFDSRSKQAVRDAGFRTAVTTIWGLNQLNDDPLELKRFTPWETHIADFRLKLDWFRFREPRDTSASNVEPVIQAPVGQEVRI